MKKIKDIDYDRTHGFRGQADLWLPDEPEGSKAVLLIHGGGWNAMDRFAFNPIAYLFTEMGLAVFNINYRLLDDAPWPACGDDCLRAGKYLLDARHPEMKQLKLDQIIIAGGSAGGHLAMMTGFRLPTKRVAAIISIAGPSDFSTHFTKYKPLQDQKLFLNNARHSKTDLLEVSPLTYINSNQPCLYCVHSVNDQLILPMQSRIAVEKSQSCGLKAELLEFNGPGKAHGFWRDGEEKQSQRELTSEFEMVLRDVITKVKN